MAKLIRFKIGDKVECIHDVWWQNKHQNQDIEKARELGVSHFMGNAAAYLHLDEAYVILHITKNNGLQLRGFAPPVSMKDVRLSNKLTYR